ncbi:unnamed protein product, partial [Owenia fusiformis]
LCSGIVPTLNLPPGRGRKRRITTQTTCSNETSDGFAVTFFDDFDCVEETVCNNDPLDGDVNDVPLLPPPTCTFDPIITISEPEEMVSEENFYNCNNNVQLHDFDDDEEEECLPSNISIPFSIHTFPSDAIQYYTGLDNRDHFMLIYDVL